MSGQRAARLDRERLFNRSALLDRLGSGTLEAHPERPPALKCLLVGVMVTLLYVWPLEFIANVLVDGFSRVLFNAVLGTSVVLAASVTWIVTKRELRHWEENWDAVTDFSPPPPPLDLGGGNF